MEIVCQSEFLAVDIQKMDCIEASFILSGEDKVFKKIVDDEYNEPNQWYGMNKDGDMSIVYHNQFLSG